MWAAGLEETSGLLKVKQFPVPVPGRGEVLVKMAAAPVNPSDMARIKSVSDVSSRAGFIAGIEGSGTVVACGSGLLPRLWLGKRVACSSSVTSSGSWAEYMVARAMGCVPLPRSISDEQGSMMLVNPLTALAFIEIARKEKHKAIISSAAASSLGHMIALLAAKSHMPVIQVVRSEEQKNLLKRQGAAHVLDSSDPDFSRALTVLAHQLKATLVLDAVGGDITREFLTASPFGSKHLIYGNLSAEQPLIDHRTLVDEDKTVTGFYLVNWLQKQGLHTTLRIIVRARKMLAGEHTVTIQARYPLAQVQTAVDSYLSNMTAGKVILIFNDEKGRH